jgi:hypothetical protein
MRSIRKNMRARANSSQRQDTVDAVHIADAIWRDAVEHYTKQNISIEAVAYVVSLYAEEPKGLKRYFGITEKMVSAYAIGDKGMHLDPEQNSYKVTGYLKDKTRSALGESAPQRESALSMLAATARANANLKKMEMEAGL